MNPYCDWPVGRLGRCVGVAVAVPARGVRVGVTFGRGVVLGFGVAVGSGGSVCTTSGVSMGGGSCVSLGVTVGTDAAGARRGRCCGSGIRTSWPTGTSPPLSALASATASAVTPYDTASSLSDFETSTVTTMPVECGTRSF
jgi:hypothetical protein